jgi:hypothetical protein
MYTKINNVSISYSFDDGIDVTVQGPDNYYYVEVREFLPNSTESCFLEGYHITKEFQPCYRNTKFRYAVNFHFDFELLVFKTDPNYGLVNIFRHRFDVRDKLVLFNLYTEDYEEAKLWYDKCLLFTDIHGCKPVIRTNFEDLNHRNKNYFLTEGLEFYTTYNIGRFSKVSNDFRSVGDKRVENITWFGLWRKFWSYQHPREWKLLTSEEIVDDILGLKPFDIK